LPPGHHPRFFEHPRWQRKHSSENSQLKHLLHEIRTKRLYQNLVAPPDVGRLVASRRLLRTNRDVEAVAGTRLRAPAGFAGIPFTSQALPHYSRVIEPPPTANASGRGRATRLE
jgi:hypothetical protein